MFGKRPDGVRVKKIDDPLYKVIPYIAKNRSDLQVFFEDKIYTEGVTAYIKKKKDEGIRITHTDIVVSALAKVLYERPNINRFIINRKIYQRKECTISLAAKKKLQDDATETIVKLNIKPEDNIFDVSSQISQATLENKKEGTKNSENKAVTSITSLPNFLIRTIVAFKMCLDKHDMLSKKDIETSPFHTSAFLTNTGSFGINSTYHNIYNFGTTSIFFTMGAKKYEKDIEGNIREYIDFKIVADGRICDELYYAKSFALLKKYIEAPDILEKKEEE